MKLVAEPDVATWLGTRPALEWDAGNSTKSQAKHGFSIADVESLLDAPVLFAGRIVEPAHDEQRYLLLGVTSGGRRGAPDLRAPRRQAPADQLPRDAEEGEGGIRCSDIGRPPARGR